MVEHLRPALIALAIALLGLVATPGWAQSPSVVKAGSDWAHLTPAQRELLAPFKADWDDFTEVRRLKWIGIADRFPKMTPAEQANIRERMREWSALTPKQRQQAREQYKKLRTVPPEERKQLEQKWREYNALPPEQKQALKAAPPKPPAPAASAPVAPLNTARPPKPVVVAPRVAKPPRAIPAQAPHSTEPDHPAAAPAAPQ